MKNPRLLQTTKTMLATVALTGLLAGSSARVMACSPDNDSTAKVKSSSPITGQLADDNGGKSSCAGKNSCKGKGGCKTGDNGCKGKNSCKGKGGCKSAA